MAYTQDWRTDAAPEPARVRLLRMGIIALSAALGTLLMLATLPGERAPAVPAAAPSAPTAPPAAAQRALPEGVRAGLPEGACYEVAIPAERLARGRMMLVDAAHPLPDTAAAPVTYGVLNQTGGRVACRDMRAVSGEDTLEALEALFSTARGKGIVGLTVFAGSRSADQQLTEQTDTFALLAKRMTLRDALSEVERTVPAPGCSEHQTAWAVDIRVCPLSGGMPEDGPLSGSRQGAWLLENSWRWGLIHRPGVAEQCAPYHFRYVGQAHAALMRALNATLEEYLTLLHECGALTLYSAEGRPVVSAVCVQAGAQSAEFLLPTDGIIDDMSEDNTGYAVVSLRYEAT